MNVIFIPKFTPMLLAAALALWSVVPATAQSAAELLEKGIYTEQTVGDLSAAIEIYQRVVESAETSRSYAAQAQLRLAECHLKQGSEEEARAAFETLIRDYPGEAQLVAQARERLAAAGSEVDFGPVPWPDGEVLRYGIRLPTGKTIGTLILKAEMAELDGVPAWQLEVHRLVFTDANSYGVSRVWVDAETQRPLRSQVRHGVLGDADAVYGPDGVEVTTESKNHVFSDRTVYDNEQTLHLVRLLPLEPGFETRLNLLPTWTGKLLDLGLEVRERQACEVPAGSFECDVVAMDIGQTHYYSTGSERYPVKVEAGGVVIELAAVERLTPGAPVPFGLEDFGFTGEVPAGWLTHVAMAEGNKAMVRLMDPLAETLSAVEIYRCPRGQCPPLERIAQRERAGAERRFDGYQMREGSWSERTLGGRPAISFAGDYQQGGEPWVQYRLYTFSGKKLFEIIFRVPVERFEELQPAFDSVAESLQAG